MTTPGLTTCPACDTPLVPGRAACIKCGLPTAKMPDLAAARRHAHSKGIDVTRIEPPPSASETPPADPSILHRASRKLVVAVLVLLLVTIGYFTLRLIRGPAVEPWKTYPTDGKTAVAQFFADIHAGGGGDKASLRRAYQAISLDQRHPDDDNDADHWGYVFQDVNDYLTGEFGPAWNTLMSVAPADPAQGNDATVYLVTIGTEQLHVDIAPQKPADAPPAAPAPVPHHFGIVGIREFSLADSMQSDPVRSATGYLTHVYGATGSAEQIRAIVGRSMPLARMSAMQIKRLLLPLVRDPHASALKDNVYRLYAVRDDPTVRARLKEITTDARYPREVQQAAREVLQGTVDEAILIELGIP